jgi:hypothetical protein
MASYKWTITGNGTIDGADNQQTVKVNAGAVGSYTLSLKVTNSNGCEANCSIQVTVKGCVPICTYTQGYYGNAGGLSCFDNPPLNTTQGALKMAIAKADPLYGGTNMATFGRFDRGQYWRIYTIDIDDPAKATKDENIFKMLPGGGKSQAIRPGSPVAYRFGPLYEQSYPYVPLSTKKATLGKIQNTLLAQTMTLYFSIQNSSPLAGTELIGASVITQKVDCGTKIAQGDPASHSIGAAVVNFLNGGNGYSNTVLGLYKLANDYLGGITVPGLSADAVAGAVGAINEAFDECRIITGWNGVVEQPTITRTTTSPAPAVATTKETGMVEVKGVQVSTFPNPFVNKVRFVIKSEIAGPTQIQIVDMQGRLIQNAYKGYINAGREQNIEVNINTVTPQTMIYKVTIGDKTTTGKLMRINK